ncbi:glutathione S-transferase 3-like [Pleurodeles waltl]|uniref:glutathione S-transferase 3-like n=1 Tax=Pleurodeles waltl TaxID=8319 RepID=UPI0037093B83
MAGKPKLFYFNGRGRMESIRWLLAAAGVEFDEVFIQTREQYEKLLPDLLFEQVPMVEMDGVKMVQSRAIQSYIAAKYNLYGKDIKERLLIDMYVEAAAELMMMIVPTAFLDTDERNKRIELLRKRATGRYFPVFEKVLKDHGQDFLVGNKLSWADVHLFEAILMTEEKCESVLSEFPLLQVYKERMSKIPTLEKFLQPGSKRKPPPDDVYVKCVKEVLRF